MASIGLRRTLFADLWCFRRAGLWALDLHRLAGAAPALNRAALPAASVRLASAADSAQLSTVMHIAGEDVVGRLRLGKLCYVAQLDGEIAAYGWLSSSREDVPELDAVFHPSPGEAYVWDCFTEPSFRGRGLMGAILSRMAADLRRHEIHRLWAIIVAGNVASERAFGRAGFVKAAALVHLKLLSLRHLWVAANQYLPAGLVAAARVGRETEDEE